MPVPWPTLAALLAPSVRAAPVPPAGCAEAVSIEDVRAHLDAAEAAYVDLDAVGFTTVTDTLVARVPCLAAPIEPVEAARVHRAAGLRAHLDGDVPLLAAAFAAARELDPAYAFPPGFLPDAHPLRDRWATTASTPGPLAPFDAPAEGSLLFDGRALPGRPTDRTTVAQWVGPAGEVRQGSWLAPSDALFATTPGNGAIGVEAVPPRPPAPRSRSRRLGAVSIGTALAALGSGAVGVTCHAWYHDLSLDLTADDLHDLRIGSQVGVGTAWVLGGLALGTGAASVALRER